MSFIIRIIAPSDRSYKIHHNFFVFKFDKDLHITTVRREAKRFDSQSEALDFWHEKDVKKAYRIEILEDK